VASIIVILEFVHDPVFHKNASCGAEEEAGTIITIKQTPTGMTELMRKNPNDS